MRGLMLDKVGDGYIPRALHPPGRTTTAASFLASIVRASALSPVCGAALVVLIRRKLRLQVADDEGTSRLQLEYIAAASHADACVLSCIATETHERLQLQNIEESARCAIGYHSMRSVRSVGSLMGLKAAATDLEVSEVDARMSIINEQETAAALLQVQWVMAP